MGDHDSRGTVGRVFVAQASAGLPSPLPGLSEVTYSLGESHADAVVVGTGAELNAYNLLTPAFLSDMS